MPYDDRLRLASIYIQSGQEDRALPLLEDAITQNTGRPEAYAILGEVLYLQGDLEGSARHLARALETGGDNPVVLNNLAWVEMGRGHMERALDLTDRAVRLDPAPIYPYLDTRSRILEALSRYEEALADAKTALRQVPDHDTAMRDRLEKLVRDLENRGYGTGGEEY
jgi:tetratricopeptide (TPR) repeat protein